ncbi:MAG: protein-L-isoaspartate(D-aspartate) O-methyltransferase, partial [Halioglobus sp.]|nr:protein-L-isoaspartate(D-aspartate) O-methyltransferase [Halioglobus sp.]
MIEGQPTEVDRVTEAMRTLPRDNFIEISDPDVVSGRGIPSTNAVSEILHHADVQAHHSVLVIGTGAGYVAALLSKLAERVIAVENNPTILRLAQDCFNRLGLANLVLRKGDGTRGAPDLAPFDRIFVASPKVTVKSDLIDQLAAEGQLLAMEQGENDSLILARYGVSQHGVSPRRELALVDFSRDSGITLLDMGVVDQVM